MTLDTTYLLWVSVSLKGMIMSAFSAHWVFVRLNQQHAVKDLSQMKHTTHMQREAAGKRNLGNPQEC